MISISALTPGDFNTGSLRDILYVPVNQIDQVKAPVSGILPFDALQYNGAAAPLFTLKFTEDTAECSYEQTSNSAGILFKCRINANVPKDYQFRPAEFSMLDNLRFFVITRDSNNRSRLHGYINPQGEKYGMRLSVDFATSKNRIGGYNTYKVEFTMDSIYRPMPIDDPSTLPINPTGGGPVIDTDPNPPAID